MKEENRILLDDIYSDLVKQVIYDNPAEAFYTLWDGWAEYCIRHDLHDRTIFPLMMRRGWMSRKDADSFTNYINPTLKWSFKQVL